MISTKLKKLVDPKNECCCEYHLAHKCKEWALKYVSNIGSGYDKGTKTYWCICDSGEIQTYESTELEAITKACEWIMEQTK